MRTRRSSTGPMIVLVVLALIPGLLLWSMFRWSDGKANAAADAVPAATDTVALRPAGLPALSTSLLSYRRAAEQLSLDLNFAAFESAVGPLLGAVNDRSCVIVSLNGRLVGARNAATVVIPASNQKILVAAVALEVLGEAFRYKTTAVAAAPIGGVISGDLFLVGGGDPLLSGTWYPTSNLDRFGAFNITPLDDLAGQLKAAGVTSIQGAVRGDGSRYDNELYAPGWAEGVQGLEAGPYDALLVNDSRVQGDDQRGADPSEAGAREFVRMLIEQGITVTGGPGVGTAPAGGNVLAAIESLPIGAAIAEMLTNSDNNTAELMVKEIGLAVSGLGTRQAGLDAIVTTVQSWGIDTTGMVLDDGSGLSLDNRITCSTLMAVLQHAGFESPVGQGLAVAGETGTLIDTFGDTVLTGRLRGKTGTLNNPPFNEDPPAVKALSGYLPVEGGGAIEYVLVLNGPTISDQSEYRSVWGELVTALSSFPAVAGPAVLGPR